ncbi:MAG: hypothetical protein CMJ53_02520 [Planctomycetaceae bacterium]|nr:hypothetical protein [Planctomycetaceae bacterium]|tara:strand:+ start:866 stop:1333 length:468 start_codon:yes stop_codon:yes gene_type:complete
MRFQLLGLTERIRPDMIRNLIAAFLGMLAGMTVNMSLVLVALFCHPMPEGVDFTDTEAMPEYFATLPATGFLVVLAAHLGQSFFGGLVAALLSKDRPRTMALIIGVLSLIGGVVNLTELPHPTWMWIEVPGYLLAAWFAASLAMRLKRSSAATSA